MFLDTALLKGLILIVGIPALVRIPGTLNDTIDDHDTLQTPERLQ